MSSSVYTTDYNNKPMVFTTKYFIGGDGSVEELAKDVDELKERVGNDETQISNNRDDIDNLDERVEALEQGGGSSGESEEIEKLRCTLFIKSINGGTIYPKFKILTTTYFKINDLISPYKNFNISVSLNGKNFMKIKENSTSSIDNTYYFNIAYKYDSSNGFIITNCFDEIVLKDMFNQRYVISSSNTLDNLINNYGTDYFKTKYAEGKIRINRDAYTVFINDKNQLAQLPTSIWTSSDYESMTNLKNWVESKSSSSTSSLKIPVNMLLNNDIVRIEALNSNRVISLMEGSTASYTGYYFNFTSDFKCIVMVAIKENETCPSITGPYGNYYFATNSTHSTSFVWGDGNPLTLINNDGSLSQITIRNLYTDSGSTPQVYVIKSDSFTLKGLRANIYHSVGVEVRLLTPSLTGSNIHYYTLTGNEGDYLTPTTINPDS